MEKTATQYRIEARLRDGIPADYTPAGKNPEVSGFGTHSMTEWGHGWMPYLQSPRGDWSDHSLLGFDHPGFETREEALAAGEKLAEGDSALGRGYTLAVSMPNYGHTYLGRSTHTSVRQRQEMYWHSLREEVRRDMESW